MRDHQTTSESFFIVGRIRDHARTDLSRFAVLLVALGLFATLGCKPRSDRLPIDGKVTLNGTPLDSGSIRFGSMAGQKLFASGAMIQNGEYHIPQEKGLPPGTYHLEINAPDSTAPLVAAPAAPGEPTILTAPERIPAEYNVNSKKAIEVAADSKNQFDFDIVSRTAKK